MKTRNQIISEAKRQREEIVQYFRDTTHWNIHIRKPDEAVIDADPDGSMKKIALALASGSPPFFFPLFEHMSREHGLTLLDSELSEIVRIAEKLSIYKRRMEWLHTGGGKDAEGYEWGIYRVKWNEHGQPLSVWATFSDFSDLDAEMAREAEALANAELKHGANDKNV